MQVDPTRQMLRHAVATLAYRLGRAVKGVPPRFELFDAGEGVRAAGGILSHIGDLLDWALSMARGEPKWNNAQPLAWEPECGRVFAALEAFDAYLGSSESLAVPPERLFQGPIADALTHVGQIALLRRLAGAPMRSENYFKAEIVAGRAGEDQAAPRVEF